MNRRDLVKAIAAQTETDVKTVDAVLKGSPTSPPPWCPRRARGHHRIRQVREGGSGRPHGRNPATVSHQIKASKKARITPSRLQGRGDDTVDRAQAEQGVFRRAVAGR